MFKHILLATDGSKLSEQAIKKGVAFAKEIGAKVTAFHAAPHFYHIAMQDWGTNALSQERLQQLAQEQAKKYVAIVERMAIAAGVPCTCLTVTNESPYEAIIEAAETQGCDLIFMASHGWRGLKGLVLGSETVKVLTHCKVPVLVYR